MFGIHTYLIWLLLFVALPLIALAPWRRQIWPHRRAIGWVLLGALGGGWIWDLLAVRIKLWYYNPDHIYGIWIVGLPIEEWLWIAGVTLLFSCLTILLVERNNGPTEL